MKIPGRHNALYLFALLIGTAILLAAVTITTRSSIAVIAVSAALTIVGGFLASRIAYARVHPDK